MEYNKIFFYNSIIIAIGLCVIIMICMENIGQWENYTIKEI